MTAHRHRRLPPPRDPAPAPPLHPTADVLRAYLPTIVKAIALTTSLMHTAQATGSTQFEDTCHNYIGMMDALLREAGLRDEYERLAREIAEGMG